jgi:hypothetical protein
MASGRLGSVDISATTDTIVYTVPTSTYTVCSISICNRNTSPVTIRLALATTGTPTNADYIEYETTVVANGVFERTGLVMDAGLNIVAYSDTANVSINVYGIETNIA